MESAPATPSSSTSEGEASPKQRMVSRRLAIVIAAAVVLVLALGWAVDSLGTLAPTVHFSNGAAQQAGLYRVALTLDPAVPHAGSPQRFTLTVSDTGGKAVSGAHVQLTLTMATMEMPPIQLTAAPSGSGVYTATGALSMPGEWHADVTLTPPAGATVHTQFDIAAR